MASHSGDDERTPLLGNEGVKPIMDQIKRLRKEEDDLLVQSGTNIQLSTAVSLDKGSLCT